MSETISSSKVHGGVVAAFIASSIGIISIGVLTFIRHMGPFEQWLVPYKPTAQYGGIFLYGNIIWAGAWVCLFFFLRSKQNVSSLRTLVVIFLISLAIGTILCEASLNWSLLPSIMQVGGFQSPDRTSHNTGTLLVAILKDSSIQGNPAFDKEIINVKTDDTITWINQDSSPHTITSGAGPDDQQSAILFDSGFLSQDQKYSFRVSQLSPGTYDYYCLAHPFMKGKFIIK